jgi:hypothetical protein
MFGMAGPAFCLWIDLHHPAMNGCRVEHLSRNIYVASRTTIIHAVGFPGSGMTGFTVSRNISMRRGTAKYITWLCIQSAWAIHGSAAREGRNRDHQSRHDRGNKSYTRKKAQAICLHLPPYPDMLL